MTLRVERGKGQQHIRVEHVDVHAGGQAIVGAVAAGEGGKEKSDEQVLAPSEITHEPSTPMWSHDPEREAVPVPGGPAAREAPRVIVALSGPVTGLAGIPDAGRNRTAAY